MSIYIDNGYKNRTDYLKQVGDEYGADYSTVLELSSVLGPDEDFDGLINALEDWERMNSNNEMSDDSE